MEYLTIADFAGKAGVTPQAVYKRLKTDLAPFVKEENGVKLVEDSALELYKPSHQTKREKGLEERARELELENEKLKADNEKLKVEKVELLEKLTANNDKLLELLSNHQILLAQEQQLHSRLLQPPTTVEEDSTKLNNVDNNDNKRSLIFRLFRKNK